MTNRHRAYTYLFQAQEMCLFWLGFGVTIVSYYCAAMFIIYLKDHGDARPTVAGNTTRPNNSQVNNNSNKQQQ